MQRHCLNYGQYCYELYTVISIDVVLFTPCYDILDDIATT